MIIFRCEVEGCISQGVDCLWEDQTTEFAMCGGCGIMLLPIVQEENNGS